MKSKRNKKLLACFLLAMGISTNRSNVSANFSQCLGDARFALKIFGGAKVKERNKLNDLAEGINEFLGKDNIDIENEEGVKWAAYCKFGRRLYKLLNNDKDGILKRRINNDFNSELVRNLRDLVQKDVPRVFTQSDDYLSNLSLDDVKSVSEWLKSISKIVRKGGHLTVWTENMDNAIKKLANAVGSGESSEKLDEYYGDHAKQNLFNNFTNLDSNLDSITLDSYMKGSLVYSPLSLKAALIMAANGTSNPEVRKNVANYMGFNSLENANDWLSCIVNKKIYGVNIANSMWCTNKLSKLKDINNFKQIIVDNFIDVQDGHNNINDWVSKKTEGNIPMISDKLDEDTLLVLVNTIYFNSEFVQKFDDKDSIEFKGINGKTTKNVPTIKDKNRNCDYCETNDYQAVRIPFQKNGCYLYMILPKTNNYFDKVKNIDIKKLVKNMSPKDVCLEIPRFRIESSLNLNDYCNNNNLLQNLMNTNLDNINPKAKISKLMQKVVFEITDKGVQAAAASVDYINKECYLEDEKKPETEMIFNHAFIGFITDKDNNALFKFNVENIDGIECVNCKTGECVPEEEDCNENEYEKEEEDYEKYEFNKYYSRAIVKTKNE